MGYCPYMCVFCGEIEDNGWYLVGDKHLHELLDNHRKLSKFFKDEECGQDVCVFCIRKYKIQLRRLYRLKEDIAIEDDFSDSDLE
jgi:NADH:ubiquinone oxidoreductase subunit F (NADH-binding)